MDEKRIDLEKLATEQRNPQTMALDEMSTAQVLETMNREDENAVRAVKEVLPEVEKIVDLASESLLRGGRILYIGAGTSGRLGVLDAVECPPTFGVSDQTVIGLMAGGSGAFFKAKEGAEDSPELGQEDLRAAGLTEKDTVIGLTASGRTPYVIGALQYARSVGCRTAAVSCNRGAAVSAFADVAVEAETGPEVLSGSTRLKAGTAEKLILNMISTACMVRSGKVYKNLMVDVMQTNRKLAVRAENIVMQAAGCTRPEAAQALSAAHGAVKNAIVQLLLDTDAAQAERLLKEAGGRVGAALSLR